MKDNFEFHSLKHKNQYHFSVIAIFNNTKIWIDIQFYFRFYTEEGYQESSDNFTVEMVIVSGEFMIKIVPNE